MTARNVPAHLVAPLAADPIRHALTSDDRIASVTRRNGSDGTVRLHVKATSSDHDRCRITINEADVVIEGGHPEVYNSYVVPISKHGTGSETAFLALATEVATVVRAAMNEVAGDHGAPLPFPNPFEVVNELLTTVADALADDADVPPALHDAHHALCDAATLDPLTREQFDADEAKGTIAETLDALRYYASNLDADPQLDALARGLDLDLEDDPAAYVTSRTSEAIAALRQALDHDATPTRTVLTVPVPAVWYGLLHFGDVDPDLDPFDRPIVDEKAAHDAASTSFHYDDTRQVAIEVDGVTVRPALSSGQSNYWLGVSIDTPSGASGDTDDPSFDLAPVEVTTDDGAVFEVRFVLDWSAAPARRTTAIDVVRRLTGLSKRAAATVVDTATPNDDTVAEALACVALGGATRRTICDLVPAVSNGRYDIEHTHAFSYVNSAAHGHLLTVFDRQVAAPMVSASGRRLDSGIPDDGGSNPVLSARNLVKTTDRLVAELDANAAAPQPDLPPNLAALTRWCTAEHSEQTPAQIVARRAATTPEADPDRAPFGVSTSEVLRFEKAPLPDVLAIVGDTAPKGRLDKAADLNQLRAAADAYPGNWSVTGSWVPALAGGVHRIDVALVDATVADGAAAHALAQWLRHEATALDSSVRGARAVAVWDY